MDIRRPGEWAVENEKVVVLNASFELFAVVTLPRAVGYVLLEKAEVVAVRDGPPLHSAGGFTMPVPAVVRLVSYVRLPAVARVPAWTRSGLLRRDRHRCAYCGGRGATVEHIQPVSRGGRSSWLNTVVACHRCNNRKSDRTPEEAGMRLRFPPTVPTVMDMVLLALVEADRQVLVDLGLAAA